MKQKAAGINKRISEPVYPADILSETKLRMCSLLARGAWYECLLTMWRDKVYELTASVIGFSRMWGCSETQAVIVIEEFETYKPCDVLLHVTHCNKKKLESATIVTLTCRRLKRRHKERKDGANRVAEYRARQARNAQCNGNAQPSDPLPSSSVSFSNIETNVSVSEADSVVSSKFDWKGIMNRWNVLARKSCLTELKVMTDERRKKYKTRTAKRSEDEFWYVVEKELGQLGDFALGSNDSNWMITFDFIVHSEKNFAKLMEGVYRNKNIIPKSKSLNNLG